MKTKQNVLEKRFEKAVNFELKHCKNCLGVDELSYLSKIHENSLINGSMDLFSLGFKRGYEAAKKAADKN
ncbi:MAG: hypothetical protein K6A23_13575 [Butyrivibrio sp.]|nr:hypothetical protein [Butyrivibrio sp.]